MIKLQFEGKKPNSKEAFNDGIWVPLKLDGEPIGAEIRMRSRLSDAGEKLARASVRRQKIEFQKTGKFPIQDPVDAERDRVDYVVALAMDWRGPAIKGDGEGTPAFSEAGLRQLLDDEKWAIAQLDAATADDARFLKL